MKLAELKQVADLTDISLRLKAYSLYLECFKPEDNDPQGDMANAVAFIDRLPTAALRTRFIEAHKQGWNNAREWITSIRNALFTPEEQNEYLPPLN